MATKMDENKFKEKLDKIDLLKSEMDKLGVIDPAQQKNIDDWYRVELAYTSNALEGSTLSRQETAQVIEKDISVEGKSLKELIEAKNHAEASDFVLRFIRDNKTRQAIDLKTILDIHGMILAKIDEPNAGRLRTFPVRVTGSTSIMPNSAKVPELMEALISWLHEDHVHPVAKAVDAHYRLVSIHPFSDGNGRTARLLMNAILMQNGFSPLVIPKEARKGYVTSLEKAQTKQDTEDYYVFMLDRMIESMEDYIKARKGDVEFTPWFG
ncbi:MAG: Fic family protein [Patescibacteria group bacterium]|nr:Fic family protein [Patescibacteria group bacterium]